MFGVWLTLTTMTATSCLEKKKIQRGRRKRDENTPAWWRKTLDWHLVPKTLHCWVSDSDGMHWTAIENFNWYLFQEFPQGGDLIPRDKHEKILRLAIRPVYLLRARLFTEAEFIHHNPALPSHSALTAALSLQRAFISGLKLIFSLFHSISCIVGSTWALFKSAPVWLSAG